MPEIVHECGKTLKFPAGMEGRKGRCPHCQREVTVPGGAARPPSGATPLPAKSPAPAPAGPSPAGRKSGPVSLTAPVAGTPRPQAASGPTGRSPSWRGDTSVTLEPPAEWPAYLAYLEGKAPAPVGAVIPANIMLKDDADKKWEEGLQKPPPSRYHCPGCKTRLDMNVLVCTGCGLDLRTGRTVDGKGRVSPEAEAYISKIPWVAEARESMGDEGEDVAGGDEGEGDDDGKKKPRFPGLGRRPGRG